MIVFNVHLESGGTSADRDARAEQLLHLSRIHERDPSNVHIIAGDFNLRKGEDQCLRSEGWQDLFQENGLGDWTWRNSRGDSMRFDYVYIHSTAEATIQVTETKRLANVCGRFTDHVALSAVLRRQAQGGPTMRAPNSPAPADSAAAAPQSSSSRDATSADIIRIYEAVAKASADFHRLVQLCAEDPFQREDLEAKSLPPWKDLPAACGFRNARPQENGVRRRATQADKLEQRQRYAKCKAWALQALESQGLGLSQKQFSQALEGVPKDYNQRGIANLPSCLKLPNCSAWEHAKRQCMDVAIRMAADDAGRLLGDEKWAALAAEEMSKLLSEEECRLSRCQLLSKSWRSKCGLDLPEDACKPGITYLPGFFELWLRNAGAELMGEEAMKTWQTLRDEPGAMEFDSSAPSEFSLDGTDFKSAQTSSQFRCRLGYHLPPAEYPVAAAWHHLVWTATQRALQQNTVYAEHRLHVASTEQGITEASYTMAELHARLFGGVTHQNQVTKSDAVEAWRSELNTLHEAVHRKLVNCHQCTICQGVRLWKDARKQHAEWNFKAVTLLWEAIVSTVHQYGVGWSIWRASRASAPPLPAKLEEIKEVPIENVTMLPDRTYKWGQYTTKPGMESVEAAHAILNAEYKEDQRLRIAAQKEAQEHRERKEQSQPGDKLELRLKNRKPVFHGRVWRSKDLLEWSFEEENTGFKATVHADATLGIRQLFDHCEQKLYKAIAAEHVKGKKANAKARKKAQQRAHVPKSAGDLTVKGTTGDGKLLYTWGDVTKGRIEVEVTPRRMRAETGPDDTAFKKSAARESTPDRALRKMQQKVRRVQGKALQGEQERIVAKAPTESGDAQVPTEAMDLCSYSPSLRQLTDPTCLQYAIDIYEYLSSMRLHHCDSCGEEWPVWDMPWPQAGVPWVGPKAGKSEILNVKYGFLASRTDLSKCSRCDSNTAYKMMYSERNLQHLGPRHPALSALTWYESLLIARVHPVVSVITLTATGLLCYAGHICNYYVRVMDWIKGLPAALRDKKWFLVKRRHSIRQSKSDDRQKKPTTANRVRLEAAFGEAMQYMPKVYDGSYKDRAELNKFPIDGEQEMLEQKDAHDPEDLKSEKHISQETFAAWFNGASVSTAEHPCASVIHRYAVDQQGVDFRGAVSADTAWELCCRLLSLTPPQNKMSTRDLAQLLVYWLDEGQVPSVMRDALYQDMRQYSHDKNEKWATEDDELRYKSRWLRWRIHDELDALREGCASRGEDLPIDLDVQCGLASMEQRPANAEAEAHATALLEQLRSQEGSSRCEVTGAFCDVPNQGLWNVEDDDDEWVGTCSGQGPLDSSTATKNDVESAKDDSAGTGKTSGTRSASNDKPLVEAPEFADKVRDVDREPYWIPGAFPTIFQNETGDLHNWIDKEPDLNTWGPHIMRFRGWHAQAHMTFCYWWFNMLQRQQALSAKKWFVRDNPQATGYTIDDIKQMSVRYLAKNMVGYTADIPGTKASKSKLRRVILTMVRQIEIETATETRAGDVPSIFGTLTTQRYEWDEVLRVVAKADGIEDYRSLSKGKRRELVNKYPMVVAQMCAHRLEVTLKAAVVPLYGASDYVAVFEWSPTGGMVHMHYILWKKGAPRFDLHAEELLTRAATLRKAGLVAGGEVTCDIKYIVDFFAEYITEWNPNKSPAGEDNACHVAENVNQAQPHPASLSNQEMLDLLRGENPHERFAYYARAVRVEHQHDFHFPDPQGPPHPTQPCAKLLKGTLNMWYCGNGYPRDVVPKPIERSVAQDTLRPDLWRINLCRNCQVTNPHMPLMPLILQSNSDSVGVATRHQAEMYCCKYCSKYTKGQGHHSSVYDVIEDMEAKDNFAWERYGDEYEASKLGTKMHKAFMGEIGAEMCQAEVAHYANKSPEFLLSRELKYVHLYKKLLAVNMPKAKKNAKFVADDWPWDGEWDESWGDATSGKANLATKPSDVELYERRSSYVFDAGTPICPDLPPEETPEDQVRKMNLWDFFRLVRFRGGRNPWLEWHEPDSRPIVVMSPQVKLTEGPRFAFGARWALMQYHPWDDRKTFLNMTDDDVKKYFRSWRQSGHCPAHIQQLYLEENGRRTRAGAGPAKKKATSSENHEPSAQGSGFDTAALDAKIKALKAAEDHEGAHALEEKKRQTLVQVAEYEAEIQARLAAKDWSGAAEVKEKKIAAWAELELELDEGSEQGDALEGSDTEHSSQGEAREDAEAKADTHVATSKLFRTRRPPSRRG